MIVPTDVQARAMLALWDTGEFDSADIAHATTIPEPDVLRFLRGSRDVVRAMYREMRA